MSVTSQGSQGSQRVPRPVREHVEARAWWGLVLASATAMVVGMAVTAVNVVFPAIEAEFDGASRTGLSWGITGYSIALASLMLLGGRLADRLGRRRVFVAGVGVFCVASLVLALAPTAWVFVAARLGQAVGAAMASPSSLSLVLEQFPSSRRPSAIATWTGLGTMGAAIGPSFSAIVSEQFGWRWVFVVPLVATAASLVLSTRVLPEGRPAAAPVGRLDLLGTLLGTLGVAMVAAVITEGPHLGITSPFVIACIIGAVVFLPWFVHRSLVHPEPMLDLRLMRAPNMTAVNLVNVGFTAAGTASWLLYPLFMVQHWDYSLLRAGLALTPFPIAAAIVGFAAGRMAERFGTRRIIVYGALLPAVGMVWQSIRLEEHPNYLTGILPGALLFNIGWGIVYAPTMALALRGVAERQMGQASAMLSSLRYLGGGLGVATVISIVGNADIIPIDAYHRALRAVAVMAFLSGMVILVKLRVPPDLRTGRMTTVTAVTAAPTTPDA
jgi:EmrB/QacA subfamily drug resistance transporter